MRTGPTLTIAIPTFEREQSLKKCLDLLLPIIVAYGRRIELLVLDNASSDGTPAVVDAFLGKIPSELSVKSMRHERNLGMSENILSCVEHASGLYFMLLGDDDTVDAAGLERLFGLLESGIEPSAFIQGDWPSYGVLYPETRTVETAESLDYFFFAGNAWATVSRTSFMKESLVHLKSSGRLKGNVWPQTFLIFRSIFSFPDHPPVITSFPHGSMINEKWIVRPNKTYTLRILMDLLDVAVALHQTVGGVPRPRDFFPGFTQRVVEGELQAIVSIAMRDLDRTSTFAAIGKILSMRLPVPLSLQMRVLLTKLPEVLLALTVAHRFATGGNSSARRFLGELSTQRSVYRAEVLSASQTGIRVRDFC